MDLVDLACVYFVTHHTTIYSTQFTLLFLQWTETNKTWWKLQQNVIVQKYITWIAVNFENESVEYDSANRPLEIKTIIIHLSYNTFGNHLTKIVEHEFYFNILRLKKFM